MKRTRCGFTLVEVSLFLAITAVVFVGVAVGTQNSIFQQRYNDAVQNFAEFLRSTYSEVTNVQSDSTGRSKKAIYGKLLVFRKNEGGDNAIKSYNVVGNIDGNLDGNVLDKLKSLGASVTIDNKPVGYVEDYIPRWSSQIQTDDGWGNEGGVEGYSIFTGMILIVRSPDTGTVYTYMTTDGTIDDAHIGEGGEKGIFNDDWDFKQADVDFCVNPNGADKSVLRRDVRIVQGARNASGVEIISDDDNKCRE